VEDPERFFRSAEPMRAIKKPQPPLNQPETAFRLFNESVPHEKDQDLFDHILLECSLDHLIWDPALEKRSRRSDFFILSSLAVNFQEIQSLIFLNRSF